MESWRRKGTSVLELVVWRVGRRLELEKRRTRKWGALREEEKNEQKGAQLLQEKKGEDRRGRLRFFKKCEVQDAIREVQDIKSHQQTLKPKQKKNNTQNDKGVNCWLHFIVFLHLQTIICFTSLAPTPTYAASRSLSPKQYVTHTSTINYHGSSQQLHVLSSHYMGMIRKQKIKNIKHGEGNFQVFLHPNSELQI